MKEDERTQQEWKSFVASRKQADTLRYQLLTDKPERLAIVLHRALDDPEQRLYALEMISQLQVELRKEFLPDMLAIASCVGPHIFRARELVLGLPREWLLQNVPLAIVPILQEGGDEEYRRIIELYELIDRDLALKLAQRAIAHENEDVRAVGHDFLD